MRLRSWVVAMMALLTTTMAITAMADDNYPSRTGGNYTGPRWYGYYSNSEKNGTSLVPYNADHTNMTEIWATEIGDTPRSQQLTDAETRILKQLRVAANSGEQAMVDVGAFVFIPSSPTGDCANTCYENNPNAAGPTGDFQTLVTILMADGYLNANHPESSTVSSFYVADEPDINGLQDQLVNNSTYVPNSALVNAITAIRQNPYTANFPLATIVTENDGHGGYTTVILGLSLFDWIGLDDYGSDVDTYITDFKFMEQDIYIHPEGSGTLQHFFMVPAASSGLGSGGVYTNLAPILDTFNDTSDPFNSVIGIMPFKWSVATDANGMNFTSSWAPEYISLGHSVMTGIPLALAADIPSVEITVIASSSILR